MQQPDPADTQVWDFLFLLMKLAKTGRRSVKAVLDQCPACHFFTLERLYRTIREHGQDGAIYMGDLAAALHDSPQAVSRSIRILETDGLAERTCDPLDRRKTLVRLTELGERRLRCCEDALLTYMNAVWGRMGHQRGTALLRDTRLLEESLAAVVPGAPEDPWGDRGPPPCEPEPPPLGQLGL